MSLACLTRWTRVSRVSAKGGTPGQGNLHVGRGARNARPRAVRRVVAVVESARDQHVLGGGSVRRRPTSSPLLEALQVSGKKTLQLPARPIPHVPGVRPL